MPAPSPKSKTPHLAPVYKQLAEWYLRAWVNRGSPVRETARHMKVSNDVVKRLVDSLKMVYIGVEPGYFPQLQVLERFGQALGYELHISLEETDVQQK